jgi:hypothetical protein
MELIWTTSVPAGALHAARAFLAGRILIDQPLARAIEKPAHALAAAIGSSVASPEILWHHLSALVTDCPMLDLAAGKSLSAEALARAGGQTAPAMVERLGGALADVAAAMITQRPRIGEELLLRRQPLHDQWEARGPGLLAAIGRQYGAGWLVDSATIVLVPPVLGGAGAAYPIYNRVTFEAVLANPIAQLPEVLRLAWLLAQLHPDLVPDSQQPPWQRSARLALVTEVLTAAEGVELASADRAHFLLAAEHWLGEREAAETHWLRSQK